MRTPRTTTPRQLTKEQDEQRLRGLRALARLIVRAHLASTARGGTGPNGAFPSDEADRDAAAGEGEHAE